MWTLVLDKRAQVFYTISIDIVGFNSQETDIHMRLKKTVLLVLISIVFLGALSQASEIGKAFSEGKFTTQLRYRFELVDQEGINLKAKASTARFRLGYTTEKFAGFSLHADMEMIRVIGKELYNSTDNGKVNFPVVADPKDTELNQAFLSYSGIKGLEFTIGRQRIKLDNDRFIGNVGWRQNEQTYDAFRFSNTSIPMATITFIRITNVNRIFGAHHRSRSDLDLNTSVLHVSYNSPLGKLTAYNHFFDNQDVPETSHQNIGIRFTGNRRVSESARLLYTLEYTQQNRFKDGAIGLNASYSFIELGFSVKNFSLKGGYESLGGDGTYAFSTPLATLHAFNGWADIFLATPAHGLVDQYIAFNFQSSSEKRPLTFRAVYHIFKSEIDNLDYGHELDLLAQIILRKGYLLFIKYAHYQTRGYAATTKKFWAGFQFNL
ncbi:MAG: alginate export family protein [Candidatus Aminicenantaceae bacterium]